ncbi:hypothetical protein [Actinospica robiniae]|uniref:hypothetical protein n=1 Tax=Actinospica robiniae TaxID=304901 RepID=UPI0012F7D5EA|nr:hypothetical protein [Actinospica robiniae]
MENPEGPQDAVPQDAVPQDAVPQDAVPQDAVPQQGKDELWAKLLDGGVTEVYVPGYETSTYGHMRTTLGLEPIVSRPYLYDREGVPRDAAELEEVARQLAAEPRWLAGGGPWFWDRHFAERAELVLVVALDDAAWHRSHNQHPVDYLDRAVRWSARRVVARGREKAGRPEDWAEPDRPFLQAVSSRSVLSPMEAAVAAVRDQYPEKTFFVGEWNLGLLKDVRAR